MSKNVRPFVWNDARTTAATLVAEDRLSEAEIAGRVGVTDRQVRRWRQHPEFAARVDELRGRLAKVAEDRAVGRRRDRVRALDKRWKALQRIIEERAADPQLREAPGGSTGLLVHHLRAVGSGPAQKFVHEYELDAALLKALLDHERQAAQECGQWLERTETRMKVELTLDDLLAARRELSGDSGEEE